MGMQPGIVHVPGSYLVHYRHPLTPKLFPKFHFKWVQSPLQTYRKQGLTDLVKKQEKACKSSNMSFIKLIWSYVCVGVYVWVF